MKSVVSDVSVQIKWSLPEGAEEPQNAAKELLGNR